MMVIKLMFLCLALLNAYFILVEAVDDEIIWAYGGGEKRCEMLFKNSDKKACYLYTGPTFRGDSTFMRMFNVVLALNETVFKLREVDYRCVNLEPYYENANYKHLVAEKVLYGTFYLESPYGQFIKKGKFGPLFVRSKNSTTWSLTKKIPGFDYISEYNGAGYLRSNYFIPYLRRDYNDITRDYDSTLKEWQATQAGKRDFRAGASISVVCQDQDKHCEPPASNLGTDYLVGYTPLVREVASYDMNPRINLAYLDVNMFHLDLQYWIAPGDFDSGYNWFTTKINDGGIPNYANTHPCRKPKVHFVLYDSNPAPHDVCETDPLRWDLKNGEVRAVFGKFAVEMTTAIQPLHSGIQTIYLVKSWDIALSASNWNEDQLRFLGEWQKASPEDLDESDTSWYKNWRKATGMSVAFTFCACKDNGGFDNPIYGCRDYVHKLVDIRGRTWLQ